jgi:dTDP-D-glucose 4,6-dehydratase
MMDDTTEERINPQKALRIIAATAPVYAQARANRIYVEEYRKSLKAILMKEALSEGYETAAAQEREAYANKAYVEHLAAIRDAIQEEEALRWKMVAAEAAVEVWRSLEASARLMDRSAQ